MECYSVKHNNKRVQVLSSSGGAFTALSDVILLHSGKIIGMGYNYFTHEVEPMICRNSEERDQLRGSKYIQGNMKNIFKQIKTDVEQNKNCGNPILFVGTPCQVVGLKTYLKVTDTDMNNLYFCDIICHGVPSPGLWKKYIGRMAKGKTLEYVTFKNKRLGWKQPLAFAIINGLKKSLRPYTLLYFGELISRPSCSHCPYASIDRISDITIGDHWGIEHYSPEFYSRDGVSLVITNTKKGKRLFKDARDSIQYKKCSIEECLQPNMQKPTLPHKKRESFWNMYCRSANFAIFLYDIMIIVKKIKTKILK